MFALFRKEINNFLNSLIGYIVIIVFLVTISLFLWIFPGTDFNIFENGYANLDGLFYISPWVFMFLIPAITMRSFAEERKVGTIEMLLTRPISDWNIILAKYFAGLVLVIFSLAPTLIYFICIYILASPEGNVDTGSIWGSYIGLLFLAAGFVAIGIFSSSISDNQIISFLVAVFLSFFCYVGFDLISSLDLFGKIDMIIQLLGISSHYVSLSRGVIDTRDVVYFLSIILFFLLCTHLVVSSRR